MKKALFYIVSVLLFFVLISSAYAASSRDGKRKFKKYCYKKCHKHGDIVITPNYMTSEQWIEYFKNNHEKLKEAHPNGELEHLKLKKKHYNNIIQFLITHALDSEQPDTCG